MGYVAQTAGLGPASLKAKEQQIVYQKLGKIIAIDNDGNILGDPSCDIFVKYLAD